MIVSTQDEIQLIQRAAQGDDQAFSDLFHHHFQAVYDYARWMCADPSLAEDLTQEAFIRAHQNLPKFGPPWKLRAWLFRLAHNLLVDHTRQVRPSDSLDVQMPQPSNEPGPERQVISAERAVGVRRAIRDLPEHHREALVLREFSGFSYADIAETMDASLSYIKVLLHRARIKFKENYGQRLLTEEPLPACNKLVELLDVYRDGEADAEQSQVVRTHLKECETCQQRERELTALAALISALPPYLPPLDLTTRILKRVRKGSRVPGGVRRTLFRWTSIGIGALLVAGLAWAIIRGQGSQESQPTASPTAGETQQPSHAFAPAVPTSTLPGTSYAEFYSPTPSPSPTPSLTPTQTPTSTLTSTPEATSTFTPVPDTQGPKVGGVSDAPDPIYTNGNSPDSSTISASVSDVSGVASVTLYYRKGSKSAFQVWSAMSGSGGSYGVTFGPFSTVGTYEYRIYAVDSNNNPNCSKSDIASCPGGTVSVILP